MFNKIKKNVKSKLVKYDYHPVYIPTLTGNILNNKVALITGGSSGIGYGIASAFVREGARVIITGRNEKKLKQAVDNLGNNASYIIWDSNNITNLDELIFRCIDREKRIDIVVNNAGYHGNQNFFTISESDYDNTMNVNLKFVFFLSQAAAKYMISNKIEGHILNIASGASMKPAWSPYEISKWGVRGFTRGLARELIPYNIVVNGIAPGPIATNMSNWKEGDSINWGTPAGRLGLPCEIGNLAVYMCSDLGKFIVGDTVFCDGGAGTITSNK